MERKHVLRKGSMPCGRKECKKGTRKGSYPWGSLLHEACTKCQTLFLRKKALPNSSMDSICWPNLATTMDKKKGHKMALIWTQMEPWAWVKIKWASGPNKNEDKKNEIITERYTNNI